MQLYTNNVQDRYGNALKAAQVTVLTSGGTLATLYEDNGSTLLVNPVTTDASGEFAFYAANGAYSFTVRAPGMLTETVTPFELYDAIQAKAEIDAAAAEVAASQALVEAAQATVIANTNGAIDAKDGAILAAASSLEHALASAASRQGAGVSEVAAAESAAIAVAEAASALASKQSAAHIYAGTYVTDPLTRPDGSARQAGDVAFINGLNRQWTGVTWQASDLNTANLAASGGAGLLGYGTTLTVADKLGESVSVLQHIPKSEHAAIRARTSVYDCAPAFALAFAAARKVTGPAGQYCVSNLVIPENCSFEGELSGNANNAASYSTTIKHIATSLSDVITCNAASEVVYRSGGVINNVSVLPGGFSRYGINFTNPLGARVGNIHGAGYFSGAFVSIKGSLYFEVETLNYLYSGPLLTPAAVHFRSFNGEIIGTTAVFRRVYIHGHGSDPTQGIYNAFKFDPAACLNTHIELCTTESISGPVFEIGKGNTVWMDRHYIENVPNSNTASAPIFRVGVTGAAAPNDAYDTTTGLHLSRLWGLGYTGGAATNIVLIEAGQTEIIALDDISINRVNTLIATTIATQKILLRGVHAPSVTIPISGGMSTTKIIDLGGNGFALAANIIDSSASGLAAERVNLLGSMLRNGSQYHARDKGTRGSLEIYNKTTGLWGQTMPALSTAPTTGIWNRGDVVFNMFATAGVRVGWICTFAGTPGTWEPFGQVGMLTSVAATPAFVGQVAVVGAVAYMAVGVASAADWKALN